MLVVTLVAVGLAALAMRMMNRRSSGTDGAAGGLIGMSI